MFRFLAKHWGRKYAPFLIFLLPICGNTAPFTPTDDGQVLETLPSTLLLQNSEVDTLRKKLKATPNDINIATRLALLYIQTGRSQSDPRYFGYAQSALSPWWHLEEPPSNILLLRATLNQGQHDFAKAEADLHRIIKLNRRNQPAWWLLTTVYSAQGKHKKTEATCTVLAKISDPTISSLCYALLWSRTGKAEKARELLIINITRLRTNRPLHAWAATLQAEISSQLGDAEQAKQDFKLALSLAKDDPYLLKLYADHLLSIDKYQEIVSITEDWSHDLALAIRAAIAAKQLGDTQRYQQLKAKLHSIFELEDLRRSNLHQREAAFFQLEIENNAEAALALAKNNWQIQKEPEDAYILLKAASQTNDTASLILIQDWLQKTGLQDTRIEALLKN